MINVLMLMSLLFNVQVAVVISVQSVAIYVMTVNLEMFVKIVI